jgi:hypothetical protein
MTIRAGFLGGGMRRADYFHKELKNIMVWYEGSGQLSPLDVRGWTPIPLPLNTPTISQWEFDINKHKRLMVAYTGETNFSMYDIDRWEHVKTGPAVPANLTCLRFSAGGELFAAAHTNGLNIYDTETMTLQRTLLTGEVVTWCAFNLYDRRFAATIAASPYIKVYDVDTWTALSNPAILPTGTGRMCAWSRCGEYLAVGHVTTPFMSVYSFSGGMTKITLVGIPGATAGCVVFSSSFPLVDFIEEDWPYSNETLYCPWDGNPFGWGTNPSFMVAGRLIYGSLKSKLMFLTACTYNKAYLSNTYDNPLLWESPWTIGESTRGLFTDHAEGW